MARRINRLGQRKGRLARAALASVAASLAACGGSDAAPQGAMPPALVTAATAVRRDVPLYLDEIGRCLASEIVTVMPQVSGKVTDIAFQDGADLAPNAPLFTIDPRPYQAKLAEANARVTAATAGVTEARAARDTAAARLASARSKRDEAKAKSATGRAMAEAARGDTEAAQADAARAADDLKRMEGMSGSGAVSQQDLARARTEGSAADARFAAAKRREAAAVSQASESLAAETSAEEAIHEAESMLAEAEAKIKTAEADLTQATAAVEPARLDVEYCSVASPIAGRAGRRLVDKGNVVTASTTPLLSIQRIDPIYVEFSITENDLLAVQRSMKKHPLKAEAWVSEASGALAPNARTLASAGGPVPTDGSSPPPAPAGADSDARTGDVVFLDNAVQESTGTLRMRVSLANSDGRFWPGRFARVRLLLDTLEGAVLVPASAPQVSAHGPFVYVLKDVPKTPPQGPPPPPPALPPPWSPSGFVADMRPVRVGQRHGDFVVIADGLVGGERVIVERQFFVFPGMPVMEPPAGAGGAPPDGAPAAGMEPAK